MQKLFTFKHYREVVQARIDASSDRGYKSQLALAAGCKGSYLSQLLNGSVHLTPEHAYGMAKFWALSKDETDFFLLLLYYDRAGNAQLRDYYLEKITALREAAQDIGKSVHKDSKVISDPLHVIEYYARWQVTAIHVLLGIPGFQQQDAIAKRLKITAKAVEYALNLLARLGLAEQRDGAWRLLQNDIHLPKDSPFVALGHAQWRYRAIAASEVEDSVVMQFSAINSVANEDIPKLKAILFTALEAYRNIAKPSAEEELVCMNLDFFKL